MSSSKQISDIVIVKPGTSTLTETLPDGIEQPNLDAYYNIGQQVLRLQEAGCHPIIVTSGFIAAGMQRTGTEIRPDKKTQMPELQRLSSVGALPVLAAWQEALGNAVIDLVLLTKQQLPEIGITSPERNEALTSLHTMLRHGDVPIINENDPITHEEIEFGDNDTLAATVAARMKSQSALFGNVRLVLLSDVDGVIGATNKVIRVIKNTARYAHLAQGTNSKNGTGGMETKFKAANIANEAGVPMWIANGQQPDAIARALNGEIGTYFPTKNR